MDECGYKDGKFEGCDNFNGELEKDVGPTPDSVTFRCLHCHTDIRKPIKSKQPTHEEIWNNIWYEKYTRVWCRVIGYRNGEYALYHYKHMQCENYKPIVIRSKEWFIGKRSAPFPLETE